MTLQSVDTHSNVKEYRLEEISIALKDHGFILEKIYSEISGLRGVDASNPKSMSSSIEISSILQMLDAWLWQSDKYHKFTFISPHFREHVDIDPAYFLERTRFDIISPSDRSGQTKSMKVEKCLELMNQRQPFHGFEYCVMHPDVGDRWFRVSGRPIFSDGFQFEGYWGIASNITSTKRKLDIQVDRGKIIADALDKLSCDVSVLILDSDQRIVWYNEHWRNLHSKLDCQYYAFGTDYEVYLRAAIGEGLFPEASEGKAESFLRERIFKNQYPPEKPFAVRRQKGINLSIQIQKLEDQSVLIVSTPTSP